MADLVERIWDGPFDALLPNMSILRVGETYQITEEQAQSGHWKDPNASATPRAPAPTPVSSFASPTPTPTGGTD